MSRLAHFFGPYAQAGKELNHPDDKALPTSSDRVAGHYDIGGSGKSLAPEAIVGKLDSKDDRLKILQTMTQNGTGDIATGEERCGAAVLLAGAIYGGGGQGIGTLINAVEGLEKTKGPLSEDMKKQFAEMDALKAKLAKGGEISAGELAALQRDVYGSLVPDAKDNPGMKDKTIQELFKSSPELAKMWKENDLSYESIDVKGRGVGGHAVLGIGHDKHDKAKTGPNTMIYDPLKRKNIDPDAVEDTKFKASLEGALQEDLAKAREDRDVAKVKGLETAVANAHANTEAAMAHQRETEQGASQLITDPLERADYRAAEDRFIGPDGQSRRASPYQNMF